LLPSQDTIAAFDRAVDPTNKAGARPAAVTVVTFGSQNVGDREWAGHFSKKINARNIAFQGDLFTEVSSPAAVAPDWPWSVCGCGIRFATVLEIRTAC
jgi:hypothetical protein